MKNQDRSLSQKGGGGPTPPTTLTLNPYYITFKKHFSEVNVSLREMFWFDPLNDI